MPTDKYLLKDSSLDVPSIYKSTTLTLNINQINLDKSKVKVLFILQRPDSIIKERWYLVQVDIEYTLKIKPICKNNGK